MKITIRPDLSIGDDCPTFIIAEVGSNWRTLEDCLFSIEQAKECGADAVKFQLFDELALYGLPLDAASIWNGISPVFQEELRESSLQIEWLPQLKEKAEQVGVEFMCSAFSPELIDFVNPYVNIHKLASAEMCHLGMLNKLCEIGKPVFMSTGGHNLDEIMTAITLLGPSEKNIVVMYCVSAYPAQEIYLETIPRYRRIFGTLVGYSDHSLDVRHVPSLACQMGASVLEKHFTAIPDLESPDRKHSLTALQFKKMVESVRKSAPFDHGPPGQNIEESAMRLKHNRRLIAIRDIKAGDILSNANFGIFRSLKEETHAYWPFLYALVEGKRALRDISVGDGIGEGDHETD